MIPATLALVAAPICIAVLVYLIRKVTLLAAGLGAATALAFAWLASAIPPVPSQTLFGGLVTGGTQVFLGRTLALGPSDRLVLISFGLIAAGLFLLSIMLRPSGIFYPSLIAFLGLSAAVLVNQTFVFRILLVEIAAIPLTILLQGARFGNTRGAWRFFLFITLAMPPLLVAGWHIDFQAANPAQSGLLNPAVLLLTLGFLIYLGSIPFHLWVSPIAREAHPLAFAAVMSLFPMLILSVIMGAFDQFSWFAASPVPFQWFSFAGALTTGLGALLAFHACDLGGYGGYNLLIDGGAVLMLLGLHSSDGYATAWSVLLVRAASLAVWAVGLTLIRHYSRTDQLDDVTMVGWKARLATAVLVLGGLSLAGFPLTPGFAGRWISLDLLAQDTMGHAIVLLLGTLSGVIGIMRIARALLTIEAQDRNNPPSNQLGTTSNLMMVLVLLATMVISLYPEPIFTASDQIVKLFSTLP